MWLTDGQTDGQTDGRTDGRTPYHNTSEVLLRAYKNEFVEMCGPQIQFCLFTFRPIALKQITRLTTINTFSWLMVQRLHASNWGVRGPGFNSSLWQGYLCVIFLFCCVFYSFVQNTLFVTLIWNSFCNVHSLSIINISQNLRPIIRVSRYRPSIFKLFPLKSKSNLTIQIFNPEKMCYLCTHKANELFKEFNINS